MEIISNCLIYEREQYQAERGQSSTLFDTLPSLKRKGDVKILGHKPQLIIYYQLLFEQAQLKI